MNEYRQTIENMAIEEHEHFINIQAIQYVETQWFRLDASTKDLKQW